MDIQARERVTQGVAQIVTDAVVADLRKGAPTLGLIASEDLRNLVGFETQRERLGCQDTAWLAAIGGARGVDELVVGSLAKLGSSYILDLRLIDARRAKVIAEANERLENGTADDGVVGLAAGAVAATT